MSWNAPKIVKHNGINLVELLRRFRDRILVFRMYIFKMILILKMKYKYFVKGESSTLSFYYKKGRITDEL